MTAKAAPIEWQSLPPGVNPIYAVALTPDGQYVACGRANQIFIYNVASGQLVTRLTDPELISSGLYKSQGVAHLDLVQSLAFSPDGQLLASGGFREVKLWRRPSNARLGELAGTAVRSLATSPDGKWAATGTRFRRDQVVGPGDDERSQDAGRPHGAGDGDRVFARRRAAGLGRR